MSAPSLRGLPAFVFMGRTGVRFLLRSFVDLRGLDQWNNRKVLDGKEYEPRQGARPEHCQHELSKLTHNRLSDKETRWGGACRGRHCACT
jgi:hypothetical protein